MPPARSTRSEFTPAFLEKIASQLQRGTIPLPQVTVTDSQQPGLRALIRASGVVAFHCSYTIGETRPYTKIGELGSMSIDEARKICRTVQALAEQGIDPFAGLVEARVKELQKRGTAWRP